MCIKDVSFIYSPDAPTGLLNLVIDMDGIGKSRFYVACGWIRIVIRVLFDLCFGQILMEMITSNGL